jgi:DNA-binding protein HU-beta
VATVVTLRHLATELAEHHDMTKRDADELMKHVVEMLVQHLKDGDRLRIGGLGMLEVKHRPARMGRNPATGEAIQIKASRKIAFRPSKELKEAI